MVDFFAEVPVDKFIAFRKNTENCRQTIEDEERFLSENPISFHYHPTLTANGVELRNKSGHGELWLPESCREDGSEEDVQAKYIVEHYGFDLSQIWVIRRCTFPSDTKIEEITSLSLKMERTPEAFSGIHFTDPCVGDTFEFIHPVHNTKHTLTVTEYKADEIEQSKFASNEWIFPTHMTAMGYTITPDLSRSEVSIRDCANGDSPRRKETASKPNGDFCSAIGVIRSADGPTAVMVGSAQSAEMHTACSSLYFEKQDRVEWRMSFRVKMIADTEVELL